MSDFITALQQDPRIQYHLLPRGRTYLASERCMSIYQSRFNELGLTLDELRDTIDLFIVNQWK